MNWFEEDMQVDPRIIALALLEHARNNRARKAWPVPRVCVGLKRQAGLRCALLPRSTVHGRHLATPDHNHVRGQSYVDGRRKPVDPVSTDRKPPRGVQQIRGVVIDRGELQTLYR